jgi:hypothetical protein
MIRVFKSMVRNFKSKMIKVEFLSFNPLLIHLVFMVRKVCEIFDAHTESLEQSVLMHCFLCL